MIGKSRESLPVLYSFRRCPYAIRARLAIRKSQTQVELREVLLADKPEAMLECSPKGTVPVLVLDSGRAIDESLDIMLWALAKQDMDHWLPEDQGEQEKISALIKLCDNEFKQQLDGYKYSSEFSDKPKEHFRNEAEVFLQRLELMLTENEYLITERITIADIALLPFIRQFALVDKGWFDSTRYKHLQVWLNKLLATEIFKNVMQKYPRWQAGDDAHYF